ncbi:hypothetical protein NQZ68_033369 [Dissostichus eleginoides]|nr:hypothetical protein NQZ68_033369 [Dissostichus eleginoides]
MSKSKQCEAVRVVVRCRPFSRKEESQGCEDVLQIDDRLGQITIRNPKAPPDEPMKVFTFDSVYGWDSKQVDIYDDAVRPLVESVLKGFNGLHLRTDRPGQKYLVRSSYMEIYQEEVRDLLCKDNNKKLELKENPDSGVYVRGLSSVVTKNATEIEHVMNIGNQSRSVGFTNMNERSSRSHAIFVITVECSEVGPDGEDHIRVGS